ncbi:BMC domain-containing protein [Pseudodesulfovibrio sp. zrk46]|uniref:BMC domain-containing protein n=1 Tax=Pseudodesulfovibrio sp. zrk46 TaxID=2725288 RepID=UPI001449B311|nr:BMC domain-containing protein [Pseudodesulfovibrio sp. zrk46]QJB57066.1 BMC domain-containing protein [Pseudodesulfovibrio sp. zrk46]
MDTLGVVECRGIAAGIELADAMMKTADVELVKAGTICSGRYMIYVSGDRAAVAASVQQAEESGRSLKGSFVISNISRQLMAALKRENIEPQPGAIGIIECRCVSAGIAAADATVKRSDITLAKLVTGQGINGKSYFVISGDVASVREAADTAEHALGKDLIEAVVIPRPDASIVKNLIRGVR